MCTYIAAVLLLSFLCVCVCRCELSSEEAFAYFAKRVRCHRIRPMAGGEGKE